MNTMNFFTIAAVGLLLAAPAGAEVTFLNAWGSFGSGDGQFNGPDGVAVGPSGQVYVADYNRIQRFAPYGEYELQWGGSGGGDGQFSNPEGVAVSETGQVYVADTLNHRIQRFSGDGAYELQWGDTQGSGNGEFNLPTGVAVSPSGNVYVADTGNHRIQRFSGDGAYELQWGDPNSGSGDGEFDFPAGVAVSPSGNVYVADTGNHRIQRFTPSGGYQLQWGDPNSGSGDGEFSNPEGVAVNKTGQVYVADTLNHRIQRFDADGAYELQWGFTQGSGDGEFNSPEGVAVSPSGNVYVADTGNDRIQRFFDSEAWTAGTNEFVNTVYGPIDVGIGPGEILDTMFDLDSAKKLVVAGTTSVEADGTLILSGGTLDSRTLAFNGGTLGLETSVTVSDVTTMAVGAAGGTVNTAGHNAIIHSWLTGIGVLEKAGAGTLTLAGAGSVGAVSICDGSMHVASTIVTGRADVESAGTLEIAPTGRIVGPVINYGSVQIDGEIVGAVTNFGSVQIDGEIVGDVNNSAILQGGGEIAGALTNNASGEVRIRAGERLLINGPLLVHTNSGRVEVFGGESEFRGAVTNSAATGRITGRNAILRFNNPLQNDGVLALSYGTSDVFGVINNTVTGGITVTGESQATFYDDLNTDGTVQTSAGSSVVYLGDVTGDGDFTGSGTVYFEGDVYPGSSAGQMNFEGDVVLSSLTTLGIEIGGDGPTDYDRLDIAGTASLDGRLDVSLIDPNGGDNVFVPSAGNSFQIISAAAGFGGTTFATQTLPELPDGLFWSTYHGTNLFTLDVLPLGDINGDGQVNDVDVDLFTDLLLNGPYQLAADMNEDGVLNGRDVAPFVAAAQPSGIVQAIPEPATFWLTAISLLGIVSYGWRQWKQAA